MTNCICPGRHTYLVGMIHMTNCPFVYSDLIHEEHPVDRYPICWPKDWEETVGFHEYRATKDENLVDCPECLEIIDRFKKTKDEIEFDPNLISPIGDISFKSFYG